MAHPTFSTADHVNTSRDLRKLKTSVTGTVTLGANVNPYVGIDTASSSYTITLPEAAAAGAGKEITIKDETGNLSASIVITLDGNGAETIDGAATYLLDVAYASVTLISNGTNWFRSSNFLVSSGSSAATYPGYLVTIPGFMIDVKFEDTYSFAL